MHSIDISARPFREVLASGVTTACTVPRSGAGVLVLSEFAGAAQSLGAGAILVNPWNITDMAAAIQDALTMSEQVQHLSCELAVGIPLAGP